MFLASLPLQIFLRERLAKSAKSMTAMDTKRNILVVDDNPDIITIVRNILEGRGYAVQSAVNGREVFTRLGEGRPDVIILDIMMPGMDGLEVLSKLREDPETATIPVILLTAKSQYEDILEGYRLGTDYYITKPFTSTQIINGINLVLSNGVV